MQYSDPCPFDVVIVHKIDRFARKLVILLDIVENFAQHGIGFISTKELFDTETAFGKAML
ncbi:MAG: recombinase family protein [bacterium]